MIGMDLSSISSNWVLIPVFLCSSAIQGRNCERRHLRHMQDEYFSLSFGRVLPESKLASYRVVLTKDANINDARMRTRLQGS